VHAAPLVDGAKLAARWPRKAGDLQGTLMEKTAILDELQQRLSALLEGTPAADLQRNLKALLTQQFAQLDLVNREEFDAQARVLARTREKLAALERRLAEMEAAPK
jgi:ubiquinone biosynthesis accessory factor UbiK